MKKKPIEIQEGNVVVKIYETQATKKGRTYTSFVVSDYSDGNRKLHRFADIAKAKAKAKEIAGAIRAGQVATLNWDDSLRLELRKALEAIEPTGVTILPASQLFAQAVGILGGAQEILAACQYWKEHRPDKPFSPKTVKDAKEEFLARKTKISARRKRTLMSYLTTFTGRFEGRLLHEVSALELTDFVAEKDWKPKTQNDFLNGVSLLYKEAQARDWVPKNYNPCKAIAHDKLTGSTIGVFQPWEAVQILNRIDGELVPFLALWLFAGIRKEEISRLTWQEINKGLESGSIYLPAAKTKTGQDSSVPVLPNLRAWLWAAMPAVPTPI